MAPTSRISRTSAPVRGRPALVAAGALGALVLGAGAALGDDVLDAAEEPELDEPCGVEDSVPMPFEDPDELDGVVVVWWWWAFELVPEELSKGSWYC